ncbi:hypothetical protein G647_07272 [Cladophialophora carrionii CBS 160.54]|uniref:Transaldolase n=1 Tax=Cladophialophora carrionii CBS 160.54 TaxID=1279043 RepID=V9D1Y9_9EURO|nr:uncharacterized protein G647_07272 [Cladophialophora carrionii CBS 160.54]ETI20929.1 hypothetical protein G647_07272 [Cladophialophora carrionii CBS 160.54]
MAARSLLDRLEELCNVDVDDVDTEVIKSLPFTPHNRDSQLTNRNRAETSNQAIITKRLLEPKNKALLEDLIEKYGKQGWEHVYNMAAITLCARNIPYLSGRVLVQTSLRHVHDRDAIIKQCLAYAVAFEQAGVSRDRFAIKLPFSGSAASAALELNAQGIRTLATAVFSLEQAIAASQSNCLFISPYYNEIAAHLDPSLRPLVEDPALEHPMSARVIHILKTYAEAYVRTGKEQPILVIASHFNTAEILAMAELGCQHVTIQAHNLQKLMETPDTLPPVLRTKPKHPYAEFVVADRLQPLATLDPLAGPGWDGVLATMDTDFVADGGAKLDKFIETDAVLQRRFGDACKLFLGAEEEAKAAIEKLMVAKGV